MATAFVNISIHGEVSLDDLAKITALFPAYADNGQPVEEVQEKVKPTRTRAAKAEPEPKVEEPAEEAQPDPDVNDEADAPAEEEQEAGPTKDDAEKAARALVAANGRDAMAEALAKFKASNLSTLKESDYAKFIAHCKKATK